MPWMESPEKAGKVNTRNGASLILESAPAFLPDEGSSSTSPPSRNLVSKRKMERDRSPSVTDLQPTSHAMRSAIQFPQQNSSRDNINKIN